MQYEKRQDTCSFAPPSGLPAISPSRGEISPHGYLRQSSTLKVEAGKVNAGKVGAGIAAGLISPLEGEMAGRPEGGEETRGLIGIGMQP